MKKILLLSLISIFVCNVQVFSMESVNYNSKSRNIKQTQEDKSTNNSDNGNSSEEEDDDDSSKEEDDNFYVIGGEPFFVTDNFERDPSKNGKNSHLQSQYNNDKNLKEHDRKILERFDKWFSNEIIKQKKIGEYDEAKFKKYYTNRKPGKAVLFMKDKLLNEAKNYINNLSYGKQAVNFVSDTKKWFFGTNNSSEATLHETLEKFIETFNSRILPGGIEYFIPRIESETQIDIRAVSVEDFIRNVKSHSKVDLDDNNLRMKYWFIDIIYRNLGNFIFNT